MVVVLANTIVLYLLFLRIYTEVTKYKRAKIYAVAGIIALFIVYLLGNFLPLWWITTTAMLTFVLAHIYIIYEK